MASGSGFCDGNPNETATSKILISSFKFEPASIIVLSFDLYVIVEFLPLWGKWWSVSPGRWYRPLYSPTPANIKICHLFVPTPQRQTTRDFFQLGPGYDRSAISVSVSRYKTPKRYVNHDMYLLGYEIGSASYPIGSGKSLGFFSFMWLGLGVWSSIGLAGWEMRVKMEAGCGMTDILMAGCGIKVLRRERDLLIWTGRMRDRLKIDGGMRDENQKITGYGLRELRL